MKAGDKVKWVSIKMSTTSIRCHQHEGILIKIMGNWGWCKHKNGRLTAPIPLDHLQPADKPGQLTMFFEEVAQDAKKKTQHTA